MGLPQPSTSASALVTGASAGIGIAIARELASRGHGVILVARREERLRELATELADSHDVRAEAIGADLADPPSRDRLGARVEELALEVSILVNNAGFGSFGKVAGADRERQVEMVRLNAEAVIDLEGRYLPAMVARGAGAVINIASSSAFQPLPGSATYAATKAFVLSHGEAVHAELKGTGVTLTTVCPGPVRTEFTEAAGNAAVESAAPDLFWMSAESIAAAAVEAAEKGKRAIVPGLINQAGAVIGQHAPRSLALPLIERIWRRTT